MVDSVRKRIAVPTCPGLSPTPLSQPVPLYKGGQVWGQGSGRSLFGDRGQVGLEVQTPTNSLIDMNR